MKKKIKITLQIFGIVLIVFSILPFLNFDHWVIRMFDFPHLQITILTFIVLLVFFQNFNIKHYKDYIFALVLSICFIFQISKIYSYTRLAKFEVMDASQNSQNYPSIYTANVLQENEKYTEVIKDAKGFDADVLLFTETDSLWTNQLSKNFSTDYPHQISIPQENIYGILLFSKLQITEQHVNYFIEDTIPSIDAILKTKFDKSI